MIDNEFLKAAKAFNRIMNVVEDLNILAISDDKESFSTHDGDFKPQNISDLVKECEYQMSLFYESGHTLNDMKEYDNKEWHRRVNMLKRFINKYKK